MTFHRLANPSYFIPGGGPLLPGYDLLNDPTTTGGTGIPVVPDPGVKVGGVYDGVYFIADGSDEAANAYNLNRPARAMGESVDLLDDTVHRSIAQKTTSFFGSVGDATIDLDGSVDNIYTGVVLDFVEKYFQVSDGDGKPIFVNGRLISVVSSSVAIGSGFSSANPLTLTFSDTIPTGINYYIYYTVRRYLGSLEEDTFATKSANVALNTTGYQYDNDVVTVSDGGTLSGLTKLEQGDYDGQDITLLLSGSSYRGLLSLRAGDYLISGVQNWTFRTRVQSDRLGTTPTISVAAGRGTDVLLTADVAFKDVFLGTDSTANYHFIAQASFSYDGLNINAGVASGALELAGSQFYHRHSLKNLNVSGNISMLGVVPASLLLTGRSTTRIEDSLITVEPSSSTGFIAYLYIDAFDGIAHVSGTEIGNGFLGAVTADGLRINNCTYSGNGEGNAITFENCSIRNIGTSSTGWALNVIDSTGVHFKNCHFFSERGQCIRIENSGVTFEDCTFESGTDTGLTNAQLICGEGYVSGANQENSLRFINCRAIYGAANVRATGAPTKPIIELGGRDATVQPGRVEVDGLYIRPSSTSVLSHQYTAFLFHNDIGNKSPNIFQRVTIDELGRTPTGAGTLAKYSSEFQASALLAEFVCESGAPTEIERLCVENLRVINVKAPATSIAKGLLGFSRCRVNGMVLDGSAVSTGDYSKPLVDILVTVLRDPHFFPFNLIETSSQTLLATHVSSISGLRYDRQGNTDTISAPIVDLVATSGGVCELLDSLIFVRLSGGTVATTASLIGVGHDCRVHNVDVIVTGVLTGGSIIDANGADCISVQNSRFHWKNTAADTIAEFTGCDYSVVMGNQFLSFGAGVPVVNHTGTSRIPNGTSLVIADVNVVAGSVSIPTPVIY